jgi:hypothetical protein
MSLVDCFLNIHKYCWEERQWVVAWMAVRGCMVVVWCCVVVLRVLPGGCVVLRVVVLRVVVLRVVVLRVVML